MVQSPSWEANWFAASQEIPRISRNPKVHYRTHKCPPPVSILSQLRSYQNISPGPRLSVWTFRNKIRFHCDELLAPRPTAKLEDTPLVGCPQLFIQYIRSIQYGLDAVPLSATWGRAIPWWQGPTYHGILGSVRESWGSAVSECISYLSILSRF